MNLPSRKEKAAMNFIAAFQVLQADAAAINKNSGFSTDDPLMDEFEDVFRSVVARRVDLGMDVDAQDLSKYLPLFTSFRNARTGLKLALIMGELGETLEAVRKNMGPDSHIPEFSSEEAEAADAAIRLMNYATDRKLRLAEAIVAKNEFNRTRHDHTKEGRAEPHGKKF